MVDEKYCLNNRSELVSKYRRKRKFLLENVQEPIDNEMDHTARNRFDNQKELYDSIISRQPVVLLEKGEVEQYIVDRQPKVVLEKIHNDKLNTIPPDNIYTKGTLKQVNVAFDSKTQKSELTQNKQIPDKIPQIRKSARIRKLRNTQ